MANSPELPNFDNHEGEANYMLGKGDIYQVAIPPASGPWVDEIDYNVLYYRDGPFEARVTMSVKDFFDRNHIKYSLKMWQKLGLDLHSVIADPMFIDPVNSDYRVKSDSPALKLGFKNFDMDNFGLLPDFPEKWGK